MNHNKTCFIIPTVASGGIEMYLLRYLNFIGDTSQITVLIRSNEKGELYEDYKKTGVQLKFLPLGYLNISKTWQHYNYYKNENFGVICDFNANFAGVPLLLAKRLKITKRIAFYRQGSNHFQPNFIKNRINSYMNRLVYNNATHILSNSHAAFEFFFPDRKSSDTRFTVIYNGVNIEDYELAESKASIRKELGIPQEAFVVGHVGRLDKTKNHDTILKVFQEVRKECANAFLVLCGRDTERLLPQIVTLNIKENSVLLGYRNDVPRVLKSLDCFLFPSFTEGQPNALIEAMVSGIPIVASDIPSIRECVPLQFLNHLEEPLDVKGFKKAILNFCCQNATLDVLSDIRQKFDQNINFEIFNKVLNE